MSKRSFGPAVAVLGGPGRKARFHTTPGVFSKKRKQPSNKSLNKKIKTIQNRQELKHLDRVFAGQTITTTEGPFLLNGIAIGDTDILRDGNEITCTSIQWRLRFQTDLDRIASGCVIRMIVFWDRQANGADPTLALLLDLSVITNRLDAPYNHNTQERFKILHDQIIIMEPMSISDFDVTTGTTTTFVPRVTYKKGKRQLNRITKYDGATNAIDDIVSNSLYVIFVSDLATDPPIVSGGFRLYFKDD